MSNDEKEAEKALTAAKKKWINNPREDTMEYAAIARFFFFAGAEFGTKVTKKIYDEIYGEPV